MTANSNEQSPIGAVMINGAGIGGIQSALDLAESGYFVYLVEKEPGIGGTMPKLDKTFPTNDCAMCILSPKLVECGRHPNIELMTLSEIEGIEGKPGHFQVSIRRHPRYVDPEKCIACGQCAEKCPRKKIPDAFNQGLNNRAAAYIHFGQTVPLKYAIDAQNCIYFQKGKCRACEKYCPAQAINFEDQEEIVKLQVGSIIMSSGFSAFDPSDQDYLGYQNIPDVITSLEYERMLSASGPYQGHVVRFSDGQEPKKIGWVQCVGSRNINRYDKPYCSSVCCMYAIKQALVTKEHIQGQVDLEIFYMDIRTHGKDFEAAYNRASDEGVSFIRSRVHTILPGPENKGVWVRYADEQGKIQQEYYDLFILSVGLSPAKDLDKISEMAGFDKNSFGFATCSEFTPVETSRPGIYASGTFSGPKDIPQTVIDASAAACAASSNLAEVRGDLVREKTFPPEQDVSNDQVRIGVFICSCGINIAGVIDVQSVKEYASDLPGVVFVDNNMFTCSQDTQDKIVGVIKEQNLNRVVIAACTPKTHEPLFQETLKAAGINAHLITMANIRNQNSWVHAHTPEQATEKAKTQVAMAVAKAARLRPLKDIDLRVTPKAMVVGGGIAGLNSALSLAEQGYRTHLVEQEERLGGNARYLGETAKGQDVGAYLQKIIEQVINHPLIEVHLQSKIKKAEGFVGNFRTTLQDSQGREIEIEHGATLITTGATEAKPSEYEYGKHPRILTHLETDQALKNKEIDPAALNGVVFIQCVGSREEQRPYCSRICCTHSVHQAIRIKEANPRARVVILYRDIRTYGEHETLYQRARELGVLFIRFTVQKKPRVSLNGDEIEVQVTDHILGQEIVLKPDLLCLASGIIPRANDQLLQMYKISANSDGWLQEAHIKLRPVDFSTDGVFMAGLAHYPKTINESIAQAQAAVSRAATVLSKTEMTLPGNVASIDKDKCVGCGVCWSICPYSAIEPDDQGKAEVNQAICKGCGLCAASCRSGAPNVGGFYLDDIVGQVTAALN